jgi:transcriptional regulator with XRE-family HTH domain
VSTQRSRRPQRQFSPIGLRVRELRNLLDISQEELAERSGLRTAHINMIEGGERKDVRSKTLAKLAKGLGCEVRALLAPAPGAAGPAPEVEAFVEAEGLEEREASELRRAVQVLGYRPAPPVLLRLLDLIRTELRAK